MVDDCSDSNIPECLPAELGPLLPGGSAQQWTTAARRQAAVGGVGTHHKEFA